MDLISLTDNVLVSIVKLSDISFELSPFEVTAVFSLVRTENDGFMHHFCKIRRAAAFSSIALKFGVFTGEIYPQFP